MYVGMQYGCLFLFVFVFLFVFLAIVLLCFKINIFKVDLKVNQIVFVLVT